MFIYIILIENLSSQKTKTPQQSWDLQMEEDMEWTQVDYQPANTEAWQRWTIYFFSMAWNISMTNQKKKKKMMNP